MWSDRPPAPVLNPFDAFFVQICFEPGTEDFLIRRRCYRQKSTAQARENALQQQQKKFDLWVEQNRGQPEKEL